MLDLPGVRYPGLPEAPLERVLLRVELDPDKRVVPCLAHTQIGDSIILNPLTYGWFLGSYFKVVREGVKINLLIYFQRGTRNRMF